MSGKKANRAFLITIICYIGLCYVIGLFFPELGSNLFLDNLMVELVILLPILLFALFSKEKLVEFLGFHKIKIGTVLMTILFTFLSMPVITLLNLISQLWVDNAVVSMMDSYGIGGLPFWKLFFPVGIIAPVFEEVSSRGAYYRSYRKTGSGFKAMMLSAVVFALFHMNLNQAMYAFGMGILAVMLVEASGSLWTSIIYHSLVNGSQTILLYFVAKTDTMSLSDQAQMVTTDYLLFAIGVYMMLTAVMLPVAWAVLVWISNHEGNNGILTKLWTIKRAKEPTANLEESVEKKKDKTITVSLVIALILCVLAMSGLLFEWVNRLVILLMTR